jgi:hypothetical protein
MVANLGHRYDQLAENIRLTQELERAIMARPGTREVYMHMRWHTQHPGEACPVCEAASNRDQQK